jgi:hypothetical protein
MHIYIYIYIYYTGDTSSFSLYWYNAGPEFSLYRKIIQQTVMPGERRLHLRMLAVLFKDHLTRSDLRQAPPPGLAY